MAALAEDLIRAAGAVVWRSSGEEEADLRPDDLEVALVHRPKYDDWSLPKGKLTRDEHVLAAAVREVREETGQLVALGRPLPPQHYEVDGRPKEVLYWAATLRDGRLAPFEPNREVDAVRWVPAKKAREHLTHPRDSDVVDALLAGPLQTVPVMLLRHTQAIARDEWTGDDPDRPLSEEGLTTAERLVELLDTYVVKRVLSSDSRRCLDTVQPYARQRGLQVDIEPTWSEEGFAADSEAGRRRARALLDSAQPTVISGHRQVLPELARALCAGSSVPPPYGELEVGAFWVVHIASGRAVALEQHEPTPPGPVRSVLAPLPPRS